MDIRFEIGKTLSAAEFVDMLQRSTLAERRPLDDVKRVDMMLKNANLLITAWKEELLVGVARAITDYSYCCYLSDLAVDVEYQNQGIGKKLIELTHRNAGYQCSLILISAPGAIEYYKKLQMEPILNGFIKPRSN